jgi:hypothetical protein
VKCRFCFEWLDPSKRPSWSTDEQAPRDFPAAERGPTSAPALHEVARPAVDLPQARSSSFEREVSRAKPIASFLEQSPTPASMAAVLGPDGHGRAGGAVAASEPRPNPLAPPRYQAPGPFPQGQPLAQPLAQPLPPTPELARASAPTLGQPAPAPRTTTRWQPGEDSGPTPAAQAPTATAAGSWDAASEPEPEPEQGQAWTPPNWLLTSEPARPSAPSEAPSWTPPAAAPRAAAEPSWASPSATPAGTPVWTPPDHTPIWSPPRQPEARPVHTPASHLPASTFPVDDDDEFDDFEVARPAAAAVEPPRREPSRPRRHGRIHEPLDEVELSEPAPARAERPRAAEPEPTPVRAESVRAQPVRAESPAAAAPAPAKPAKPAKAKRAKDDDDDDFDDDDDDFDDDDDDDDDETGSMPAMSDGAMSTAAAKTGTRKLPWIPIAAVSGLLVLVLAVVFKDAILGGDESDAVDDEAVADSGEPLELAPPEPEPTPPEPKDETTGEVAPPEPTPPAIDPEELEKKLAEADSLYRKAKHDKAREVLDGVLADAPNEPRALALLAQVLLEKGEFETALVTANDCVKVDAKEPNCWMTIAVIEQENKNFPRALEGFQKYLEIAPDGRFAKSAHKQVVRLESKVEG